MSAEAPTNPILEGMISLLASRPHSWTGWRILSFRSWDPSGQIAESHLFCELTTSSGKVLQHAESGLNLSPSLMVERTLDSKASAAIERDFQKRTKNWKSLGPVPPSTFARRWALLEKRAFQKTGQLEYFTQ